MVTGSLIKKVKLNDVIIKNYKVIIIIILIVIIINKTFITFLYITYWFIIIISFGHCHTDTICTTIIKIYIQLKISSLLY